MGVQIKRGREWNQRIKMDGDAATIDTSNEIDLAVKANAIRALNNGDMETYVNLQSCAGGFMEKGKNTPVKVGSVTITELTDSNGIVHEIEDDPALVNSYVASGMTITSTRSEDVMR